MDVLPTACLSTMDVQQINAIINAAYFIQIRHEELVYLESMWYENKATILSFEMVYSDC